MFTNNDIKLLQIASREQWTASCEYLELKWVCCILQRIQAKTMQLDCDTHVSYSPVPSLKFVLFGSINNIYFFWFGCSGTRVQFEHCLVFPNFDQFSRIRRDKKYTQIITKMKLVRFVDIHSVALKSSLEFIVWFLCGPKMVMLPKLVHVLHN